MKNTYTLYGTVVKSDCIIENGAVTIQDGRIIYAGPRIDAPLLGTVEDWADAYLLPGFIDIHCHAGRRSVVL